MHEEPDMRTTSETASTKAYKVFTTEYDTVIHVADLLSDGAIREAHRLMTEHRDPRERNIPNYETTVSETAARLAAQFEESGIDPAEASVTLLVDGSGSTRGWPAKDMTVSTIDLCAALENLGVETTVLGYSTSAWKGGKSREKWLAEGKPANPGRLCDLLHIIYKHSNEAVEEVADNMAAMSCFETKRENIDGEALQWAVETMADSERRHRILVNVNDGFPIDDSTIWSNNGSDILRKHVEDVTRTIDEDGVIALSGVCLDACRADYDVLLASRQGMFPREVVVQIGGPEKGSTDATLEAMGEGVALGIRRAAELSLDHGSALRR